jgi:hypothetical protein
MAGQMIRFPKPCQLSKKMCKRDWVSKGCLLDVMLVDLRLLIYFPASTLTFRSPVHHNEAVSSRPHGAAHTIYRTLKPFTTLALTSFHPEHINPLTYMSLTASTTTTSSFPIIIGAALGEYTKQTGIDLTQNPFALKIQHSDSPDGVIGLFQERENEFKEYRDGNRNMINCLKPVVQVLHALSGVLGGAISLVSLMKFSST